MFTRLAHLADRRPGRVVLAAVVLAAVAGVLGHDVARRLGPFNAEDPATESIKAKRALIRATGLDPSPAVVALVRAPQGVRAPAARATVRRVAAILRADPIVGRVATYYDSGDPALLSRDGRATYATAHFRAQPATAAGDNAKADAAQRLHDRIARLPGVTLGGTQVAFRETNQIVSADLAHAELLAFPLLFALSFWFFRGVIAAALPPLVGGLSIVISFLAIRLVSDSVSISIFALNLITGLGLGLAIDYSLFVVSRYREELTATGERRAALERTLATAGRTVLYSSLTVAGALASLLIFPQQFLYSMGVGGLIVTVIAAAVALLVLPSILALLGPRVDALAPARLRRAAGRDVRPAASGGWYRLSRLVMRRPVLIAGGAATVLIVLGLPFLGIRFTSVDARVLPTSADARRVSDALESRFPPHRTDPVVVAVRAAPGPALDAFAARLRRLPQVAAVAPPRPVARGLSSIEVISRSGFLSPSSQALVRAIRAAPAPFPVQVGGLAAELVDQKASLARHLPGAFAIIVAVTFLVLFLMTGSLVLPLKALVMNVLTLSAAFGILVLIFQDGRLEGLLGYTSQGALESSQPVLLFAVAFGLSTDYGVFLLSRIKEARDGGAEDSEAVATGLERTGRIVTAAAVLFCVAIGAFATSRIIFVKELGVGTAMAVFIDATMVRALLVPSLMRLLGRRNWWAPPPLRRLHARLGLAHG